MSRPDKVMSYLNLLIIYTFLKDDRKIIMSFIFQDKSEMELKILMLEKEKADLVKKLDEAKTYSKRQAEV